MTPPPADESPRAGPPESLVHSIIHGVLGIREWRRAAMLIVLGLAALVGAIVWQARERLVAAMAAFLEAPPHLMLADRAVLEATALGLVNTAVRPDYGVVIWAVTLELNRRRLLVFAPGDVAPSPELTSELHVGYIAPLFMRGSRSNAIIVAVLDGETACGEPLTYQGHVEYACAAGIPPGPGPLIGMIAALFPRRLSEYDQETTRSALQHAAETLTVYR